MTTMTKPEFDAKVELFLLHFSASLISGRRTVLHSVAVGGFAGDPHAHGFGADMVFDVVPDVAEATAYAAGLELKLLTEHHQNAWHVQPNDWVNE